jgi:molecular chaperone DnaK (HSP70)
MLRILLFLLLSNQYVNAQLISIGNQDIQQSANYNLRYKKSNGSYYGASLSIDGSNIIVIFKNATLNKQNNHYVLSGTTFHTVADDEARIGGVKIFIARPKKNRLKNIRVVGYSTIDSEERKEGDFEVSFELDKDNRIFFEAGGSFFLLEFDIAQAQVNKN